MTEPLTLSFIVPTYGRAATLRGTLECALAQDYPNYEVVVASQDPQPPDCLRELAALHPSTLRVLQLPHPNANAARNAAIKACRGDVLLSIDDDVLFDADYATRHARHYADPRVGFIMSLTRERVGESLEDSLRLNTQNLGLPTLLRAGEVAPIRWAATCSTSYRRSAVEHAGWFDPYFTGGVGDDADIAVRILAAGYTGYLDTGIALTHLATTSGGYATRDPARTHRRRLNDQRMSLYFVFKNRRHIGPRGVLHAYQRSFRTTLRICRDQHGLSGWIIALGAFARLSWQATRDGWRATSA